MQIKRLAVSVKAAGLLRLRKAARRPDRPHRCGIESLEQRLLLSAAHVATPYFDLVKATGSAHPAVSAGPTGLSPAQLRAAYGINAAAFGSVLGDGTGQTIAIIDAYNAPTLVSDLATFDSTFNLPNSTLLRLNESGGTSLPGNDPSGRGDSWAVETSLDVEWAHAVAPKATILLVEASSDSFSDLMAAVDTARHFSGVSVVSMSWGGDEFSGETTYNSDFTTPAGHNGVTFLAATGDAGAYSDGTTTKAAGFPAASPNVVAVGGTQLSTDSAGDYLGETGWGNGTRSGTSGGSGGGISRFVAQPAYQKGVVTQSSTARTIPDVSMDASPNSGVSVIDSYDFGTSTPWITVGGTSLATPLWAAVIAIADQGRALNGLNTLDGATATLPDLYQLPASDFHDITTGNNGFAAGVGYDLVTGRGSPIVNLVVSALSGTPATPLPVISSLGVNPTSIVTGTASVALSATGVHESSGTSTVTSVVFYRESNGTSGLQTSSDLFLGDGAVSGTTWTLSTATDTLAPGVYTFYAVATDSVGVTSTVATVTLTVAAPAPLNDNFAGAAVLSGSSASATGTTVNATKESGEPSHAGNSGGHSVWYSWTAATSGVVTLSTAGSSFDTLLAVYTGSSVSALTAVASNDDASRTTLTSALAFNAIAGTTYHFAVDGYNGANGSVSLSLSEAAGPVAPANDSFASATVITGTSASLTGTNVNATKQAGEPKHAGNTGGKSVWYSWTAPANGTVSLNTHGSSFDTLLAVYTGSAVTALKTVASNDDDTANRTLTSALTFTAVAGTTYHIAVDGYRAASGSIDLNLSFVQSAAKKAVVATTQPPAASLLSTSSTGDDCGSGIDLIATARRHH